LRRFLEATAWVTRAMIHPYSDNNLTLVKKRSIPSVSPELYTYLPAIKHRAASAELPGHLWSEQDQTSAGFASSLLISSS
jgi:hypothetical protein